MFKTTLIRKARVAGGILHLTVGAGVGVTVGFGRLVAVGLFVSRTGRLVGWMRLTGRLDDVGSFTG